MVTTFSTKLQSINKLATNVYLFKFDYPTESNWTYKAGQYMIFHLPIIENGHPARRLYSIFSTPSDKKTLDFIIEIIPHGLGSGFISKIKPNDTITMQGPAGVFSIKESNNDIIMLATGTGIAPMYSMIKEVLAKNIATQKIILFWGLKYKTDIYLKDQFDELQTKYPNFKYSICLSRDSDVIEGAYLLKGRITCGLEKLKDIKTNLSNFDFYLCGSPHIVESLRIDLTTQGVPPERIYFEKFTF